jgi:hypothetical protein
VESHDSRNFVGKVVTGGEFYPAKVDRQQTVLTVQVLGQLRRHRAEQITLITESSMGLITRLAIGALVVYSNVILAVSWVPAQNLNIFDKDSDVRQGMRDTDPGKAFSGWGLWMTEHINNRSFRDTPLGRKYKELGGDKGFLGTPVDGVPYGGERPTPDGKGQYVHFQGGSIYWSPNSKAHEVHGLIREKWKSLSWERGFLGYPLTDEMTCPDKVGRFNHFQGGSIYWTPSTGARVVRGPIRDKWESIGWERGPLGYPITDEAKTADGKGNTSAFQYGHIIWYPDKGAVVTVTRKKP